MFLVICFWNFICGDCVFLCFWFLVVVFSGRFCFQYDCSGGTVFFWRADVWRNCFGCHFCDLMLRFDLVMSLLRFLTDGGSLLFRGSPSTPSTSLTKKIGADFFLFLFFFAPEPCFVPALEECPSFFSVQRRQPQGLGGIWGCGLCSTTQKMKKTRRKNSLKEK